MGDHRYPTGLWKGVEAAIQRGERRLRKGLSVDEDNPKTVACLEALLSASDRTRNRKLSRQIRFDMICEAHEIEYRLAKANHP